MEWKMVWKEILFGFTVAGFIAVLVPQSFWDALFLIAGNAGPEADPAFFTVLENAAIQPVAFFTFIGSMGNVPLAAMLWAKGASFGGVMAFLGADLVAATVVWVHVKYYGWRYALFVSALLYVCMVAAGVTVHYLFAVLGQIPEQRPSVQDMVRFAIDHTLFLNLAFLAIASVLLWLHFRGGGGSHKSARYGSTAPQADVGMVAMMRRVSSSTITRRSSTKRYLFASVALHYIGLAVHTRRACPLEDGAGLLPSGTLL
jgi:uncharacterized membrane protein YraQ (UPF0718 family)